MLKRDKPDVNVGVQRLVAGNAMPVLEWQSQHGSVGIKEEELKTNEIKRTRQDLCLDVGEDYNFGNYANSILT